MNLSRLSLILGHFALSISIALAEEKPPNVVLIFADDLGYGDLGCYGATKLKTPNIDKLAAEGRKFTDAHSASAVCTPSRYGLLTGEYPFRANGGEGIWGPAPVTSPLLIDTETLTIADFFKESGYDTAVVGKWHLGFGKEKNDWQEPLRPGPQDLGFDYYFGMPVVNSAPPYVYVENDRVVGGDPADPLVHIGRDSEHAPTPITPLPPEAAQRSDNQFKGAVEAHRLFNDYEVGTKLTEKATQWIRSRGDNPFFLYFATTNVHHPFTPAKRFQGTSECGVYGDFVHELDWMVGEVMKSLEASGAADNTLVIFTSDNGGMFNLGGRVAAEKGHKINGELLGSKFGIWEGGHRVPLITWWPGKIAAGTVSDQLVCNVDLWASVAALTGRDLGEAERRDSINMLPAMVGDPSEALRTEMIVTPHRPSHMAIRKGKWMFIPAQSDGGFTGSKPGQHAWGGPAVTKLVNTPNSDIEDGKLKPGAPPAQLYDLEADVRQTTNLFEQRPDKVNELREQLAPLRSRKVEAKRTPGGHAASGGQAAAEGSQSGVSKESPHSATTRPNFIIIFTDDQGYQDLGCFGSPDIATPHLDRMAAEGMRFTSFYAQTICGPSRAALMTGSYPLRVAQDQNRSEIHPVLHADEITIAEVLKPRGYRSAVIGKWDLATHSQTHWLTELLPLGQGFDYFFGTPTSNDRVVHLLRNDEVIERNADMATLTQRYTDAVLRFIERNKDEPFFVYLAHTMPHTLLAASEDFKGKSRAGLYGDVIEEIDHHAGRILGKVKELGLDANTYVIFTSDNGPWLLRGDHGGHALPLRSGKTTCWEGNMRVPCIVRAPGRVAAGTVSDLVTATIDLLPTIASLADAPIPTDRHLDGIDLSKIWHGKQDTLDRPYFYYQHHYLRGVRQGDWKLMLRHEEGPDSFTSRWKRHVAPEDAAPLAAHQLYNLKHDIGETTDLAAEHPDKLAELLQLAEGARNDIGDHDRLGQNVRLFDDAPHRLETATEAENAVVPESARPNVILVMTDDQGYGDLSCHGNPILKTPNLDRLHAESVRFTDFHVSPFCTPTRAALMTGNHAGYTGAFRTSSGRTMMHRDEKTLANLFTDAGYATGMVGKWHLGDNAPHRPQDRGFQDVVWHRCGGIGQASDYWGNDYFDDTYERNGEFETFDGYCTDVWFREGMQFVKENQDKPFFLYLSLNAPHGPYRVPDEWAAPYQGNPDVPNPHFYGMIANIDHNVGLLRRQLSRLSLAENTILIFMTDNGTSSGFVLDREDPNYGMLDSLPVRGYNAGMRGRKSSVYDGGHRVPFFIHWPKGELTGGKDVDTLAAHIDVLPTLADLCGITVPPDYQPDGLSLTPLLSGSSSAWERNHLVEQYLGGPYGDSLPPRPKEYSVVMTERWRLVHSGEERLFDIQADPTQTHNVAALHPEVVSRLRAFYDPFWNRISPRLTPVRIDIGNPAENPTVLCSQDWRMPNGNPPWNFDAIQKLPKVTGPWMIEVRKSGRYRITLRQYPKEADQPVIAVRAQLAIAGQTLEQPVEPGSKGVVFETTLPAGPTELITRLFDQDGKSGGAYFTEVEHF